MKAKIRPYLPLLKSNLDQIANDPEVPAGVITKAREFYEELKKWVEA